MFIFFILRKTQQILADSEEATTSNHIQASLPMMFEKQTKWKLSDVRSKTLDRMITEMIATDNCYRLSPWFKVKASRDSWQLQNQDIL